MEHKIHPLEEFWNMTPKLRQKVKTIKNTYYRAGSGINLDKLPEYYTIHLKNNNIELYYDEGLFNDEEFNFLKIGNNTYLIKNLTFEEIKDIIMKNI